MMHRPHLALAISPHERLSEQHCNVMDYAEATQSRVTLLTVIDSLKNSPAVIQEAYSPMELLAIAERNLSEQLRGAIQTCQSGYPNIRFDYQVLKGTAYREILRYCTSHQVDIIVTGARKNRPQNRSYFSSTTKHLMRKSPILVWAAAEQTSARLESIVVALDVQFGDDQVACDRLNHQLLKQAFAISTALKCPITVLHAWQLYGKEFLKYWSKKDDLCIARLAEQEFNARRKQILKTIEQFDMSRIQLKFIEGPPKSCISDYLNTVESGLLIMGSVCRTGLPGLFIGNTAETVIDSVSCNVLTVKPSDFASPIQFESSKLERA